MPPHETKDTILDAAEALFAEQGFAATSLRQLTQQADVNLAAVNYHFGSKEELVKAVLLRRVGPINAERRRRLAALESPTTEDVVRAFLEPALRAIGGADAAKGGPLRGFARIIGRVTVEQPAFLRPFIADQFSELAAAFVAALRATAPNVDARAMWLRMHFTIGAMAHTLQSSHLLAQVSDGALVADDPEELLEQLVAYAIGGFTAEQSAR
ncbi:MAG: TetR/AcrR family transcriptional regulator [Planctomycetota bacterium]|nr:TetR/AcrR family transcriptional regulator [Planctomycetota bacterium]